jgi:O-antigen/teichoic acid export membrane protein
VLAAVTASVATLGCAIALSWLLAGVDETTQQAAWWYLPFIAFNHVTLTLLAIDHGAGRFRQYNWTRLIVNPVFLALIAALCVAGETSPIWYVAALTAANGAVAIVRVVAALRYTRGWGPLEPLPCVFREALPFGTSGLMNPLLAVADKALLLYVLGEPQLGLYAVALTAASAMSSLSQAAAQVTFGMSARSNDATVFRRVGRVFRFTAWIWMLGGLVLAALMPILLPLIFGQAFEPAVWPAIVLIGAAALAGQAGVLEDAMRGQGRAFVGLEARVAGMTLFLAVGWWAARQWGIIGAAAAYVLGQSIVLAVMIMAARLHFREIGLWTLIPRIEDLRELVLRVLAIATWMRREDSCVCEGSATARSRAHLE